MTIAEGVTLSVCVPLAIVVGAVNTEPYVAFGVTCNTHSEPAGVIAPFDGIDCAVVPEPSSEPEMDWLQCAARPRVPLRSDTERTGHELERICPIRYPTLDCRWSVTLPDYSGALRVRRARREQQEQEWDYPSHSLPHICVAVQSSDPLSVPPLALNTTAFNPEGERNAPLPASRSKRSPAEVVPEVPSYTTHTGT